MSNKFQFILILKHSIGGRLRDEVQSQRRKFTEKQAAVSACSDFDLVIDAVSPQRERELVVC
jgi:hypothetical protein